MDNEKILQRISNICGYDNKRCCNKGDCTDIKLCRECEVMREVNPEGYYHYQNLKKNGGNKHG